MDDPVRILFVEDTEHDIERARRELDRDGLRFTWRRVTTESGLWRALLEFRPSVPSVPLGRSGFSPPDFCPTARGRCESSNLHPCNQEPGTRTPACGFKVTADRASASPFFIFNSPADYSPAFAGPRSRTLAIGLWILDIIFPIFHLDLLAFPQLRPRPPRRSPV